MIYVHFLFVNSCSSLSKIVVSESLLSDKVQFSSFVLSYIQSAFVESFLINKLLILVNVFTNVGVISSEKLSVFIINFSIYLSYFSFSQLITSINLF